MINTPTKGMDDNIMSGTTDISKSRADLVRDRIDINAVVTARVRAALAEADHGPKWLGKLLGVGKWGAKYRLEGTITWFVADLMVLAESLDVPVASFFEEI